MLLCDVGNTSFHFYKDGEVYKQSVATFDPCSIEEEVIYICVNPHLLELLNSCKNWIDLSKYIDKTNYYSTMGIDRIVVCETIDNGIIIDAGSALTVDLVKEGIFSGGFIYPGLKAMGETYKNISSHLDYSFNFECDLDIMPKNSQDAISYGYLKTLHSEIIRHDMDIYLTGGDAKKFAKIFPDAKVDETLVFKGMKKIINVHKELIC
jgi:type III pantothenate kinase